LDHIGRADAAAGAERFTVERLIRRVLEHHVTVEIDHLRRQGRLQRRQLERSSGAHGRRREHQR